MLYLFCGTDTEKAREKHSAFVRKLRGKHPDASFAEVDDESFPPSRVETLVNTQGLFAKTVIASLRTLSRNPEAGEFLKKNAKELAQSPNIFIVYEEDARKTYLEPLLKYAEKTERCDAPPAKKAPAPLVFAFADAVAARDKKEAWALFARLTRDETPAEQILGTLFWQFKTITLAKQGATSNVASGPAHRFARAYTEGELHRILGELIDIYHARETGADPDIALEKLVLS